MNDVDTNPVVQEAEVPAPAPVKVRKAKEAKPLLLPVPTQIDGRKNVTLGTAFEKKFARVAFYTDTKPGAKPFVVVHDPANGKAVKPIGAAMENFVHALADATLGGAGMSGDGSAIYVTDNYKKVLASAPRFGSYILEFVPAGRSGLASYRATVSGWMAVAENRAAIIRSSSKTAGTKKRTTRQLVAKEPAKGTVTF
jgi:hypothetical protein